MAIRRDSFGQNLQNPVRFWLLFTPTPYLLISSVELNHHQESHSLVDGCKKISGWLEEQPYPRTKSFERGALLGSLWYFSQPHILPNCWYHQSSLDLLRFGTNCCAGFVRALQQTTIKAGGSIHNLGNLLNSFGPKLMLSHWMMVVGCLNKDTTCCCCDNSRRLIAGFSPYSRTNSQKSFDVPNPFPLISQKLKKFPPQFAVASCMLRMEELSSSTKMEIQCRAPVPPLKNAVTICPH